MPGPKAGGMSVGGRLGRDGIAAATTIGAVQVDPRRDRFDRRRSTWSRQRAADAFHHQPEHGGSARKPLAGWANICRGKSPESSLYHFVTDETEAAHGPPANWDPRAQRQRRYLAKRTRTRPAATPVATTTASVIELAQLQAQLEKLQRDTQDEVPLPGGVGVNVKCLRLYPVEVFRGYRDQHGVEALRAIRDAADQVLGEANRPGTRP
jgi:hypothetical protein